MECFHVIAPHGLKYKTKQTKMRSLDCHLPPTSGDHTQPPLQLETILGSRSPNTTPTEAAAVNLLEGCLGNYPLPENAPTGTSACLFLAYFPPPSSSQLVEALT